jgi:hypothetical protein
LSALGGCSRTIESEAVPPVDDSVESVSPPELSCSDTEDEPQISADRRISFENVSFSLDQPLIRDVEYFATPECVLTSEDIKPDGIGGRTIRFNLRYSSTDDEANISVFKIEDYKNAFAQFPQYVEHRDAELKSIIEGPLRLKTYGLKPPPHVRWMDASETFYAKTGKIDFMNGRSLLVFTQISQDASITISNSVLGFLFQGFTSDGKYFVEMEFPATLKGLPDEPEQFLLDENTAAAEFGSPGHLAAYDKYILETAARIDKAHEVDFQPSIPQIVRFINGFEIR